ncbi:hypothetical protein CXB51_034210 [Gossypium anomalum]|uniref:Endonuclease/exonuclease/phosphatase domain-containing protein n=1 Tax=Gossypium anomalum TaxID=47600 RepID=A0A8J5Y156_9ROSI|nr:hypothetical protein CXB51_034210 [Gossypium anomalum]
MESWLKMGILSLDSSCLLDTRVSGSKADNIIAKLGLPNSHRVEAAAIGDFNAILSSSEKSGGMSKGRRCPFFGDFVDNAKLYDLGFRGPPFTWHRSLLFERLDRALGNEAWIRAFPNCLVTHLPKIKSDHRPLFLSSNPEVYLPKGRLFHFLAGWVKHPDFKNFVKDKWIYSGDMSNSLSMFTRDLKNWNKTVYGHITSQKRFLIDELTRVQKIMDFSGTNQLTQVELKIRQELDNVIRHEELLWKQKAHCDWLHFGDRNTKFFHARTLRQRKNSRINAICNDYGD